MAQVPVSMPGNDVMMGLELDVGAGYRNTAEGFYAGFTWGVLWPLAALNRNTPLYTVAEDASVAADPPHLHGREVLVRVASLHPAMSAARQSRATLDAIARFTS